MQSRHRRLDTETRVRAITARHFGVHEDRLSRTVSLRDDLAASAVDVATLAATLDTRFGIGLSDTVLDTVRTFGDLADAVSAAVSTRRAAEDDRGVPPARIVARVSRGASDRSIEHSGELTPYLVQTLLEDARRLGPGSRLEMIVTTPSDSVLARLRAGLATLPSRGIEVRVAREAAAPNRRHPSAA